jgi:hypothetical protein
LMTVEHFSGSICDIKQAGDDQVILTKSETESTI